MKTLLFRLPAPVPFWDSVLKLKPDSLWISRLKKKPGTFSWGTVGVLLGFFFSSSCRALPRAFSQQILHGGLKSDLEKQYLLPLVFAGCFFCKNGNSLCYLLSNEEPGTGVKGNFCFSTKTMPRNKGCRIAFIFEDGTCLLWIWE